MTSKPLTAVYEAWTLVYQTMLRHQLYKDGATETQRAACNVVEKYLKDVK